MSASKERLKRQNGENGEGKKLSPKQQEEMAESLKFRKKVIAVVAIFVVFALAVIMFSTNLFYRNFSAVEINGEKFSVADFNYYYNRIYYNYYSSYYNYYGDSAASYMPDASQIEEEAKTSMQSTALLHKEAVAAGHELTESDKKDIDEAIASIESAAEQYGYSVDKYLAQMYGKGMNEKIFIENLEYYSLAYSYYNVVFDSFEYSDSELASYYEENKDTYDTITYRMFTFTATEGKEGVAEEDVVTDKEASDLAYEFYNKITDEQSYIDLAYQYASADTKASYEDDSYTLASYDGKSISNYFSVYSEWMLDSGRREGDTTVIGSDGTYYVLYFIDRSSNDYPTVDVRQILISPEEVNEEDYADDAEGLAAAQEAANATAKSKADEVYKEWQDGDATEDSFAALATEYSSDTGSEGGLYEHVYKGQMVASFNDWVFDETRKPGDTGIVYSENYGYHIMYFIGDDMDYCDYLADKDMREEDYNSWVDNRIDNYNIVSTWLMWLAK